MCNANLNQNEWPLLVCRFATAGTGLLLGCSGAPHPSHSPAPPRPAVSWAEELESVKESQPHPEHASPDGPARLESPLRQRLAAAAAAAGQQPPGVVLAACLVMLMMAAMFDRILLGALQ